MASNKLGGATSDVNRNKISRNSMKEKRQDRLNYHSSHVTNNNVREKIAPGDEDTFIVPEILCQCQQKCTERITAPLIQKVSMYFFGMRHDKRKQYRYLADLILSKEKKFDLADIVPGKRLRKMSFRYFVPIITDADLKLQLKESTAKSPEVASVVNGGSVLQINGGVKEDDTLSPKRDHIEVCLKAFTNIHLISEKRVNITRSSCKLKNSIYCTKPLPIHGSSFGLNASPLISNNSSVQPLLTAKTSTTNPSDISLAAIAWLSNHCEQKKPAYAINPKTLLPEGLVLPDSVTCLPVYPQPQYDLNRDAMIVDNFFHNQLWKPEYTGGIQEN